METGRSVVKTRVARSFLRGMASYDREATIQRSVNSRLIDMLQSQAGSARCVLEIGCCTGMLTEHACHLLQPDDYHINDLVPQFYDTVFDRLDSCCRQRVRPWFGDIETCALPAGLDLVISSSTLQWLDDPLALFGRLADGMPGPGRLVFSMFGRETLGEVAELTGVGLNYPSFNTVRDRLSLRYRINYGDIVRDRLVFTNPRDVLRHIKATGVGGVGGYVWTPRKIERFEEQYWQRFSNQTEPGVGLSYVSYLFSAEKRL